MTDRAEAAPGGRQQTRQDGAGAESAPSGVSAFPHREAIGTRYGDLISEERQQELRAIHNAWHAPAAEHGKRNGPFDGTDLTGADVAWLADWVRDRDYGWVDDLHLEGADLREAHLEGADLREAHLEGADLVQAHLEGTNLAGAHLEGTLLVGAHLEGAIIGGAHLESKGSLPPANLRGAFLNQVTNLTVTTLSSSDNASAWQHVGPRLADVHWGGANLIVTDWELVATLADEHEAKQAGYDSGSRKERLTRTEEYRAAGRAYRLLSVALRAQGLSTDATRYHFRAEVMDRKALFYRRALGRWLFSWLLGTFAGYGDRLGRLFATYATVVGGFALAMLLAAIQVKANQPISPATLQDVLVLSVTSFHGRGLQPPGLHLDDVLASLAGAEAVFGLLIEGLFIAAFTRRVTGG